MNLIKRVTSYNNFETLKTQIIELEKSLQLPIISVQYYDNPDWQCAVGFHIGPIERKLVNLMPQLKGTAIEDFLKWLEWPVFRTRIMTLKPKSKYEIIHRDPTPRFHLPIITDPSCKFKFYMPEEVDQDHMPADGSLYWVDTRFRHTFVNDSGFTRIHLVLPTDSIF